VSKIKGRPLVLIFIVGVALVGYGVFKFISHNTHKDQLTLYGNIDIRDVNLGFRVFGRLEKLYFEEGDRVKAGDLLATLDKIPYQDELQAAKASLEEAKVAYVNADRIYERKRKLVGQKFVSVQEFEDFRATRNEYKAKVLAAEAQVQISETHLQDTDIRSPSDGILITRVKEPGSIANPGDSIYVLSLDQPVWVRAYVPETDLGRIALGMKARITTDSDPNKFYEAQIGFVSPVAEFTPKGVETPELRTNLVYRLRIIIGKTDAFLRQGMPVTVYVATQKP
jgi:HlyD family secretion protein